MVLLLANVLCEVVLVYHADYYRIIVTAYDCECSQHHASFHIYIYREREKESGTPSPPLPPPHPPHTRTNEEDL